MQETSDYPPAIALEAQVAALARTRLFAGVGPQPLRLMAFSAPERLARRGATVARAGDPAAPAFLVIGGALAVGARRFAAGSLVNGEGALAGRAPRHDIVAAVPARLAVIERALVARLVREYPAMGRAMMRALGTDLRALAAALRAAAAPSPARALLQPMRRAP